MYVLKDNITLLITLRELQIEIVLLETLLCLGSTGHLGLGFTHQSKLESNTYDLSVVILAQLKCKISDS